ncbi:hypothetical protein ABID97_003536 [Variovorax sp. OAS795]|uniref:hypothetical protein n=1 Tax=Variovorax sp. OAS795 TaxID=3034231 RepID=UPI00339A49B9
MAHLLRLIVGCLALWSGAAFALLPTTTGYKWPGDNVTLYPTIEAACRAWIAAAPNGANYNYSGNAGLMCQVVPKAGGAATSWGEVSASSGACPAHSVLVSGGCKCDTGYEERDGQCQTPQSVCVAKATLPAIPPGVTQEFSTTKPSSTSGMFQPRNVCIDGCQANGKPSYWACGGTSCTMHFEAAAYTGAPCSGDGAGIPNVEPAPTPPAERCPDGKVPGSVNGTNVCVTPGEAGSSSGTTGSTTNTGTNPDGTPAPSSGSGTGSTSNTSCNGTTCSTTTTTTTTTTNGSGQTSTSQQTSTTAQPQRDYCAANPKAKECAGSPPSSFSGACAGGFTAKSDDAVINAMAEETFRQNCKVNPDDAETTLAKTERVKTGNQTTDNPNNVSLSVSPSSIDTSDAIGGGGGCISDKVINVAGGTVVLPLSRSCDSFPMLGNLLVAIGFLVAAVIIIRG